MLQTGDLVETTQGKIYVITKDADLGLCLTDPRTQTTEQLNRYTSNSLLLVFRKYVR